MSAPDHESDSQLYGPSGLPNGVSINPKAGVICAYTLWADVPHLVAETGEVLPTESSYQCYAVFLRADEHTPPSTFCAELPPGLTITGYLCPAGIVGPGPDAHEDRPDRRP